MATSSKVFDFVKLNHQIDPNSGELSIYVNFYTLIDRYEVSVCMSNNRELAYRSIYFSMTFQQQLILVKVGPQRAAPKN